MKNRDIPFKLIDSPAESLGVDLEKMEILKQDMFTDIIDHKKTMPEILKKFNDNYDLDDKEWTYIVLICGYALAKYADEINNTKQN